MRSASKKTAKKHYLPIKKVSKNFQLLYFNKLEEVFRPLGFDNRRSKREQSQVYLNYAKPQGGKLQVNRLRPLGFATQGC